mmetsp:Transcript_1475/g.2526  ORF Transcript_1475/g.2526 Transcript_1475/m.2526 type:complete len:206 (-) Transcript_1475:1687-2304(-)
MNTCRTCSTFISNGGECTGLEISPNATVSEYGVIDEYTDDVDRVMKIKMEVHTRGPVTAYIQSHSLDEFMGGRIFDDETSSKDTNHIVSVVGWGVEGDVEYWILRNSWGVYWGEMGFFRVATGKNILGVESEVAWATQDHTLCKTHHALRMERYAEEWFTELEVKNMLTLPSILRERSRILLKNSSHISVCKFVWCSWSWEQSNR